MAQLPDHVLRNRQFWSDMAGNWVAPGRRAWEQKEITRGCFEVPERTVGALGDLSQWADRDVIELGCGTAYFSSWFARLGARPVGIDITPPQLESARAFQQEFGLEFPLIEGSAEEVPFPDASFDLAFSEFGASIWCDPAKWIPEAARLLRPGGKLVFLRNSTLSILCTALTGPTTDGMKRDQFGMYRLEWDDDDSVEFHPPTGAMLRILRSAGFEVEDLIELEPPPDAPETRHEYISLDWARRWPAEEIWVGRKKEC